jgi:hypothetical protein
MMVSDCAVLLSPKRLELVTARRAPSSRTATPTGASPTGTRPMRAFAGSAGEVRATARSLSCNAGLGGVPGHGVLITRVPCSRSPHEGVWSVRPPVDQCE